MDDTAIKEIADQLGIAVDQAAQFITTYLPQYASLKTMFCVSYCVIAASVFLILLVAFCVAWRIYAVREKDPNISSWENENWDWATTMLGIFAGIMFVVMVITVAVYVPQALAWSQFPEAQLINEAINAVKGQ